LRKGVRSEDYAASGAQFRLKCRQGKKQDAGVIIGEQQIRVTESTMMAALPVALRGAPKPVSADTVIRSLPSAIARTTSSVAACIPGLERVLHHVRR
jgi:hypothetical protein